MNVAIVLWLILGVSLHPLVVKSSDSRFWYSMTLFKRSPRYFIAEATNDRLTKVIFRVFHGWNGDDERIPIDMEKHITL